MKTLNNSMILAEAIHPGELLKDELSARNMKQRELSALTGIKAPILNNILKGKRSITAEQSAVIGAALGIEPDYFYGLQAQYDVMLAQIQERVKEQTVAMQIWNVLKTIVSVDFFKKVGVVSGENIKNDIKGIFEIFNADSIEDLLAIKSEKSNIGLCRKSEKLGTDENALFSWKYFCIHESGKMGAGMPEFEKSCISDIIEELNQVFYDYRDVTERTRTVLNKYGIKLVIVEKYGQIPVDGLSFWDGDNPTIALSLRHKRIDNFAFTVMHELAHIYLHLYEGNGEAINPNDPNNIGLEREADRMAENSLIRADDWQRFMTEWNKSPLHLDRYIKLHSGKWKVNPRIIYGRYCREKENYRNKVSIPYMLN